MARGWRIIINEPLEINQPGHADYTWVVVWQVGNGSEADVQQGAAEGFAPTRELAWAQATEALDRLRRDQPDGSPE
jgi:hypothetical protein